MAVTVTYEVYIPTNVVMRLGQFSKDFIYAYVQNALSGNDNIAVQGFPFQLLSAAHKNARSEPWICGCCHKTLCNGW